MKTLLILNDAPYGSERSYNGLRLAMSLTKREGTEVRVFLMGDAVACAVRGQKTADGYYNTERMVRAVVQRGGTVGCCGTCSDARALTDALRRYVSDEALRGRHGEAARARVLRDFDPGRVRAALHEEYVRLAARAGVPLEPARAHAGAP